MRNMARFVVGLAILAGTSAWADQFSYQMGRDLGSRSTSSAWLSISKSRGCDAADSLIGVMTRSAKRIGQYARQYQKQGKRDMVDYAEGYIHGIRSTLRDVATQCTDKCAAIGEAAGSASAVVFCEIAQLIGEVPEFIHQQDMPNITCGEPYRIQCEIIFEGNTQRDCSSFVGGPQQDRYARYYQASMGGCCAYNPPQPH